jgi:hypothetical protein
MFVLFIDGFEIFKDEFAKPCIEYLNSYAQGDSFSVASIVYFD